MKQVRIVILLVTLIISSVQAQQTNGLYENSSDAYNGYTLFAPIPSTNTYLIDNCGKLIHTWSSAYAPGNSVYLMESGNLLRTGKLTNSRFDAGGYGGIIEELDPSSNVVWSYTLSNDNECLHHDIEYLPNGNILVIAWELKTTTEAEDAGRDPSTLSTELWSEKIIEIDTSTNTIVWEWYVWDHLVQNYDNTKPNYGVVGDNPQLINLNYYLTTNEDWLHINAIDYNEELDQIVMSCHNFSEVWIIDHSTTTAEAAGHSGGNAGKGGDLLFRWGNPEAYDKGTSDDQVYFVQHDSRWIPSGYPGEGGIMIYNNGKNRSDWNYSTIDVIDAVLDGYNYEMAADGTFLPADLSWQYVASEPTDFYSPAISGAERQPNGNTLICEGKNGRFFEVDEDGNTVWEYINPVTSSGPVDQGTEMSGANSNNVFRCKRYSPDYEGLQGYDLTQGEPIETNPLDYYCKIFSDNSLSYPIVATNQVKFYNNTDEITEPSSGAAFYGQDAHYQAGYSPSYTDNGDGAVTDNVTGLMWQTAFSRANYYDAFDIADTTTTAGYTDWRLPTVKELYSLIMFSGSQGSGDANDVYAPDDAIPYIDTNYFDFSYPNDVDYRYIDVQFISSTLYVGIVMEDTEAFFGVNFADGRIKGYGTVSNGTMQRYLRLVRGSSDYGVNDFEDNSDATISDNATALMWTRDDSGDDAFSSLLSGYINSDGSLNWEEALDFAENLEFAGYDDWRLPNTKELHSILDYTKAPDVTSSPAIDPVFNCTGITNEAGEADYPFYWSSTTHTDVTAGDANIIQFGRSLGYTDQGNGDQFYDVHGAGGQRTDPKSGTPNYGGGPQGDVRRVYNYVRLVRDFSPQTCETYEQTNNITLCEGDSTFVEGSWQTESGTYTDIYTSVAGCDSIITTDLTVHDKPESPVLTEEGGVITSSRPMGNIWLFNGTAVDNDTDNLTATEPGEYAALLASSEGCISDTSNVIVILSTNIKGLDNIKIKVYPNPAGEFIAIDYLPGIFDKAEVIITNLSGQKVLQQTMDKTNRIRISALKEGMYILQIRMNNTIQTVRFVKSSK